MELLSSSLPSSKRSSFIDNKSLSATSMPSTLSALTWFIMLLKFSSMQARELTILVTEPIMPFFSFGGRTQGLVTETLLNLGTRPPTSPLTASSLFKVSVLNFFGFVFQLLMAGTRNATCEDTEDIIDAASALASVIGADKNIINGKISPPVMMGSVKVTPD